MTEEREKDLWDFLMDAVDDAVMAWGAPADLAGLGAFRREEAKLLRRWLTTLEAILRALLTPMALRIAPTLGPRRRKAKAAEGAPKPGPELGPELGPEPARGAAASPDQADAPQDQNRAAPQIDPAAESAPPESAPPQPPGPETWVVRFVLAPSPRKPRKTRKAKRARAGGRRGDLVLTRSYARRLEALMRAVRSPEPYARRLARLLAADRCAVARVLTRPWDGEGPNLYGDLVEDALTLAWEALGAPPQAESG